MIHDRNIHQITKMGYVLFVGHIGRFSQAILIMCLFQPMHFKTAKKQSLSTVKRYNWCERDTSATWTSWYCLKDLHNPIKEEMKLNSWFRSPWRASSQPCCWRPSPRWLPRRPRRSCRLPWRSWRRGFGSSWWGRRKLLILRGASKPDMFKHSYSESISTYAYEQGSILHLAVAIKKISNLRKRFLSFTRIHEYFFIRS